MDALLAEFFRSQPPRDFSSDVLAELNQRRRANSSATGLQPPTKRLATGRRFASRLDVRFFLAIAASLTAILLFKGFLGNPPRIAQLERQAEDLATRSGNENAEPAAPRNDDPDANARPGAGDLADSAVPRVPDGNKPPRGEPILLRLNPSDPAEPTASTSPVGESMAAGRVATDEPLSGEDLDLQPRREGLAGPSLGEFDQQFVSYWSAIGVSPAPVVDPATWANRIADRFGITISEPSGDQESIGHDFADEAACGELAKRLVAQLSAGLNLEAERLDQLVDEATAVISRGDRIDRWLADWITASQPGVGSVAGVDHASRMGEWAAGRILGADIGCARCHDSPIDSRYSQQDYWAMSSLFVPPGDSPLFYELADGRQRVADPGVPSRWLGVTPGNEPDVRAVTPEQLGELVIGNRQVARTLANHLWAIGFGSPLVAAASSPIAPPRDDAIERALEMLSDRLIATDFDIRSAADWVIHCDPMRRGAPVELRDQAWQFASEASLAKASLAQRSFAAAKAPWPKASQGQLLAMMGSRTNLVPAKIEVRDALLAQPIGIGADLNQSGGSPPGNPAPANTVSAEDHWWAQWLADREALRGGWMETLRDPTQQVRHAFYAAGHRSVNEDQMRWTEDILGAATDAQSVRRDAIAKIHWVIQNAK